MKYIRKLLLIEHSISILLLVATMSLFSLKTNVQNIVVFAGADRIMCMGQVLVLDSLKSSISGAVSNGQWFTSGDGKFLPGNQNSVVWTSGTHYIPGPGDVALGYYNLLLTSDDPDLDPVTGVNGPEVQVTDAVRITFQAAPPLFCNNNLNISLDANCRQQIDITILQANPTPPFHNYIVTLFNSNGNIIPQNTLTSVHVGKTITYKIGHACTQNICWGQFMVSDYFPPVFVCRNDTIPCTRSVLPDSLGFPFPMGAYIDTIINHKYIVKDWDKCGDVILEFKDEVIKANCAFDQDRTIKRSWKAVDQSGNVSNCIQNIVLKRIALNTIIFPPHYDDHQLSAFECSDTFPRLSNGYPSPDTTGIPFLGSCSHLQYSYTDVAFDLCGAAYKLVRSWFVIDWCTTQSISRNQLILIRDSIAPVFYCRDSILLYAGAYECATELTDIPRPTDVIDCSEWTYFVKIKTLSGTELPQYIQATGSHYQFRSLPVGVYHLVYYLTDVCGNVSECTTYVEVKDNLPPYPVCDQITKVSLGQDGKGRIFAQTFDDGSTDNCGILSFKASKITDACGFGHAFGDYVDFCCAEIGLQLMVALRVTDIHNNTNTCMVQVIVEDKIAPTISCPPNITISCTYPYDFENLTVFGKVVTNISDRKSIIIHDFYNNGIVGQDGLASDNCSVSVTSKYKHNIHCYQGTITRTFIATDTDGRKDSCHQVITIRNPLPFTASNIIWPSNYEGEGCRTDQTSPDITGKPIFSNTYCSNVASSYDDQQFYFADSACVKIIRTWTVIDWCQFNDNTQIGKWGPYVQVIKLSNHVAPVFTSVCKDTTFCSFDSECKTGFVFLTQTATDECTHAQDLIWKFEIDFFNNGTIDTIGNKNIIAAELPLGKHRVIWTVSDGCGNASFCSQFITISDCKKPTPYCLSSVTISLMQATGFVEIWANDYDLGSFDNCTEKEKLKFSFSPQITDNFKRFTCNDIPDGKSEKISLNMYVTDEAGNQDFCTIELILQDNADLCPDINTTAFVSGNIKTESGKTPPMVSVNYHSHTENLSGNTHPDSFGYYHFEELPVNHSYSLRPKLNSNPMDGISTFDLIVIQRHILGLQPLTSPYKILAADVNSSNSVTAADLVELRKLILGVTDKFPKSKNSWSFVDKAHIFSDIRNPWFAPDSIFIPQLSQESLNNDFVAIKIGDVNDSYVNFHSDGELENRKRQNITLNYTLQQTGDKDILVFRTSEDQYIEGFQMFLQINDIQSNLNGVQESRALNDWQTIDYYCKNSNLNVLAFNEKAQYFKKGQTVFEIELTNNFETTIPDIQFSKSGISEIYMDGQSYNIILLRESENASIEKFSLISNPVLNELRLRYTGQIGSEVLYSVFDINGQNVVQGKLVSSPTDEEFQIVLPQNMHSGIYFIYLNGHQVKESIKFMKLDY